MEHLVRKKNRIKKLEKRKFSKTTGTLAGEVLRLKTVRGYKKSKGVKVKIV
ncbi:MAG: hypothetical protein V1763_00255 [Parcubacteria group bacterium]